ncbi:MAG: hypothetical protein QXW94_04150 [Desulfurococcaceae archaeon]
MSFGLMSFGLGAYLFAREARKSEGECVGASKVIPIAAWLASSAITAYSLARLFASPEWHIDAAGASALLASAISALLSALLSSGRVFSSTTAAPLHSCSFGLAMFGMYSLTHALHAATRDASLKALSQGLSVAAPSLLLVGLVLLSRHEVELLMPQRPKGVLSILFEADPLAMWPQELATYVSRRCKSMHTLLVTRPASTLAPHVRCSVIALMDPSSTYPQRLGEATYRVSPEPTHIVGLINRIKNEGAKPLCLVFDSLTDIIAMSGIKEGYRTARDVLSVLEPDDVAIFVMFPRTHKEDEVTVIRTLFTHIAKTR